MALKDRSTWPRKHNLIVAGKSVSGNLLAISTRNWRMFDVVWTVRSVPFGVVARETDRTGSHEWRDTREGC